MATRKRKREFQDDSQQESRVIDPIPSGYDGSKVPAKRQRVEKPEKLMIKPPFFPLSARKLRSRKKDDSSPRDTFARAASLRKSKKNSLSNLSLASIKAPILTLKGTLQKKVVKAVRQRSMKGLQDYSLPLENTTVFSRYMMDAQKAVKDAELQQKIEREIKMRDGTAKLLAASKHPAQLMEAAKSLLTSNTRVLSYMSELQKRKSEEILKKQQSESIEGDQTPCKAKFAVSDIRIPLMWKDTDHFKNKGDHRRYAVFCLLKIGTDIFDTTLVKDVDRSKTDITFDDVIIFENIPNDFKFEIEIYSHQLHEDVSIASTPKKIKKKINDISSSMGRSVGRRLSGLKEDELMNSMLVGPRFDQVAHATLRLSDVKGAIGIYDLVIDTPPTSTTENTKPDGTSSQELPMFGNFGCNLAVQPYCLINETISGYLNVEAHDDNKKWQRYWCSLKNLQLSCWLQPENAGLCEPDYSIPVTKFSQISQASTSTCSRPHGIHVMSQGGIYSCTLAAESKDDRTRWWDALQQHLLDQALWLHACDRLMEIKNPTTKKVGFLTRKPSLYDEIGTSLDSADEDTRSTSSADSASGRSHSHSPITKQISVSYELPHNQF